MRSWILNGVSIAQVHLRTIFFRGVGGGGNYFILSLTNSPSALKSYPCTVKTNAFVGSERYLSPTMRETIGWSSRPLAVGSLWKNCLLHYRI